MNCMECLYNNPGVLLMKYKDLQVRMISLMDNGINIVEDDRFNPMLFSEEEGFLDGLKESNQIRKCM